MRQEEFWGLTAFEFNEMAQETIDRTSQDQQSKWERARATAYYTEYLHRKKNMPGWNMFVPHTRPKPKRTREQMAADHAAALKHHGYDEHGRKAS